MRTELGNVRADDPDIIDGFERYAPGTSRTVTWRHAPLAPAVFDPSVTRTCLACRSSDGLTLALTAFSDGTRSHTGGLFGSPDGTPVTHFSVTSGDHTLYEGDDSLGVLGLPVPSAPATYTATLDVDHYYADPLLSTRTHTRMSFPSAAGTGATAASGWQCFGTGCRVLPVLQGRALLPTDGRGGIAAGRRTLSVELGRVPGCVAGWGDHRNDHPAAGGLLRPGVSPRRRRGRPLQGSGLIALVPRGGHGRRLGLRSRRGRQRLRPDGPAGLRHHLAHHAGIRTRHRGGRPRGG
ncbi:MAG: hypothetical protein M3Y71_01570 [Actinomycetota bacterium]|nr:hypothetical protein [Actinomycetota bacterium]